MAGAGGTLRPPANELFAFPKRQVVQRTSEWWDFAIPRGKHKKRTEYVPVISPLMPIVARLLDTPGPWLIHSQTPHEFDPSKPFDMERWYKNY
jgi:hypothetical protein